MKIYINRSPKHGPWGGGVKTVNKLWEVLLRSGHEVVNRLEPNIDIIFCFDPRPNEFGDWYQTFIDYRSKNPRTKIIQRVGDLGTHSKPDLTDLVKQTLTISDYFIFPSQWSMEWIGFAGDNGCVIDNAPMDIFYDNRSFNTVVGETPKVVTHHWSTNKKKGFDLYIKFEMWCKDNGVDFHYIGQLPNQIDFTNYTKPIPSEELSKILPKHDIYLTASEEEAGANHVLEAMASGLPILYRDNGGSIVNYCHGYGLEYSDFDSLILRFGEIVNNYEKHKKRVLSYKDTNIDVVEKYSKIVEGLV